MNLLIQELKQCKLLNLKITFELACNICCGISFIVFEEYTNCIMNKELLKAIKILLDLFNKGYSIIDIFDGYYLFIKKYDKIEEELKYKIIKYICKYIAIFYNIHEDEIELSFFTNNLMTLF